MGPLHQSKCWLQGAEPSALKSLLESSLATNGSAAKTEASPTTSRSADPSDLPKDAPVGQTEQPGGPKESPKAAAGSSAEVAPVTSSSEGKNGIAEPGQGGDSFSSKTQVEPSAAAESKAQTQRIEKPETLPQIGADSAKSSVSGRKAEESSLAADSGAKGGVVAEAAGDSPIVSKPAESQTKSTAAQDTASPESQQSAGPTIPVESGKEANVSTSKNPASVVASSSASESSPLNPAGQPNDPTTATQLTANGTESAAPLPSKPASRPSSAQREAPSLTLKRRSSREVFFRQAALKFCLAIFRISSSIVGTKSLEQQCAPGQQF